MSNISISLSANTAAYSKRLRQAKTDTDRNLIQMERKFEEFGKKTADSLGSINGSLDTMTGALASMKGGGYAIAFVAIGAAVTGLAMAAAGAIVNAGEMDKQLKQAAKAAGMATDEFIKMKYAVEAFTTISGEQLADIFKDYNDKVGDFINTGGGALMDYFDAMGNKSAISAVKLQQLSGKEGLLAMVDSMEKAGLSTAQMTHVLESMGNDASYLLPLLKNGGKALKEWEDKVDSVSSKHILSPQTAEEIKLAKIATDELGRSFSNMLATDFEPLIKTWRTVAAYMTKAFDSWTDFKQGYDAEGISEKLMKNEMDINDVHEGYYKRLLETNEKRIEELKKLAKTDPMELRSAGTASYRVGSTKDYKSAVEGSEQRKLEFINKQIEAKAKLLKLEKESLGVSNIEKNIDKTGVDTTELDKLRDAELNKQKTYAEKVIQLNETIAEANKKLITGDGMFKAEDGLQAQIIAEAEKQLKQVEELNKVAIKREKDLLREKAAMYSEYAANRGAEEAAMMDRGVAKEKAIYSSQLLELEAKRNKENLSEVHYNKLKERLTEDHYDKLKMLQLNDVATSLALLEVKSNNSMEKLELQHQREASLLERSLIEQRASAIEADVQRRNLDKKHADDMFKLQTETNNTLLELTKSFTLDRNATLEISNSIELANLQAKFGSEYATNEQYGIELQTLTNKQAREKLELERTIDDERNEWALRGSRDAYETLELEHSQKMEMLNRQYEDQEFGLQDFLSRKLVLEQEYAEQKAQIDQILTQISEASFGSMANSFEAISKLYDEDSSQKKAMLAASLAAGVAELSINKWIAWSNVDTDEMIPENAKMPAKMLVLGQYAAALTSMAAGAKGQFHSGTDEVDSTGSYILKKGERVVQEAANKDLTKYLASNAGKGSGGTTINSDLVIQGDKKLSDSEFQGYLVQFRDVVARAVRKAESEQPSLR